MNTSDLEHAITFLHEYIQAGGKAHVPNYPRLRSACRRVLESKPTLEQLRDHDALIGHVRRKLGKTRKDAADIVCAAELACGLTSDLSRQTAMPWGVDLEDR